MFKKLVITNGKDYIVDNGDLYGTTSDPVVATNFRWFGFLFPKKIVLQGVQSVYGNDYRFEKI